MRIDQLRSEFELELRFSVFPLHPEVPPEGMELEELFAGRGFDLDAAQRRLGKVAAELDVPLNTRSRTCNSRRAQKLGKWAESRGRGDAWRRAAYRAYFVDGWNLYLPETLAEIARSCELDPDEALTVLDGQEYSAAVDRDWQRARASGVSAVPTFIGDRGRQVGFGSYEQLRALLAS